MLSIEQKTAYTLKCLRLTRTLINDRKMLFGERKRANPSEAGMKSFFLPRFSRIPIWKTNPDRSRHSSSRSAIYAFRLPFTLADRGCGDRVRQTQNSLKWECAPFARRIYCRASSCPLYWASQWTRKQARCRLLRIVSVRCVYNVICSRSTRVMAARLSWPAEVIWLRHSPTHYIFIEKDNKNAFLACLSVEI